MAGREAGFAGRRRDFPYRREGKGEAASGGVRGMLRFSLGGRRVPPASLGQSGDGGRFCSALSPQEEESPLRSGAGEGDVPAVSNARRRGSAFPWNCESRGKPFPLCGGVGKGTFRLFPMRGGELTACGAVNIAAAHWKFARKLARPPSCVRVTWAQSGRFRPCCFPVRAGGETGGCFGQFAVLLPSSGVCSVEPRPLLFAERV